MGVRGEVRAHACLSFPPTSTAFPCLPLPFFPLSTSLPLNDALKAPPPSRLSNRRGRLQGSHRLGSRTEGRILRQNRPFPRHLRQGGRRSESSVSGYSCEESLLSGAQAGESESLPALIASRNESILPACSRDLPFFIVSLRILTPLSLLDVYSSSK